MPHSGKQKRRKTYTPNWEGYFRLSEEDRQEASKYFHYLYWVEHPPVRYRRGKRVVIPEKWRGQTTHSQSIRKRPSKHIGKRKKETKHGHQRVPRPAERAAEVQEEES